MSDLSGNRISFSVEDNITNDKIKKLGSELTDLKAKYQRAVEEYDGLSVRYNKAVEAIIILVDDAEFYGGDVRKLTAFSRIKSLAAELREKE